ncbi:MAG: hypothetical protein RL651_788 [Pseudomonadota bacterium]
MLLTKSFTTFFIGSLIFVNAYGGDQSTYSIGYLKVENDTADYSRQRIVELWGYNNYQGDASYSETLRLRYYEPLDVGRWQGTMRLDTAEVWNRGPTYAAENNGQHSPGNTMITVWGNHPDILPQTGVNIGGRVIFPFGNNGQWAIGPQLGSVFRPLDPLSLLADISPTVRYMYGFDTKNNSLASNPRQPPMLRNLQIYPTFGIRIKPGTQLRFWDENGLQYNTRGDSWFIPADAMITHELNKQFLVALGGSGALVNTYQQYTWSVYGKISYKF